tara:strand:+ start:2834 stop:3088 length:255 start_codon:yes stop_codon:yes gene_type:complete
MYAIIKSHSWSTWNEKYSNWYPVFWNDRGEDYFPDVWGSDWDYTVNRMNETLKWLNWNMSQIDACKEWKEFNKEGWWENPNKHR